METKLVVSLLDIYGESKNTINEKWSVGREEEKRYNNRNLPDNNCPGPGPGPGVLSAVCVMYTAVTAARPAPAPAPLMWTMDSLPS